MQQTVHPPLTYDDLLATPDDGQRYEIIDGDLIVSASPRRDHQHVSQRLVVCLVQASDDERRGVVFHAPVDVRLSANTIVQPDVLFIRRERLDIYSQRGLVEGAPDIVVEILSPSSRSRDLVRKAELYASGGVPEYWQADIDARTLTVLGLVNGVYRPVPSEDGFARSLVLPDLRVDVPRLFMGV